MNKIQLFIEENEIELNENVSFAITKQFEDINNPTTIINSWTKTVEIPGTDKNNKIFGNIFQEDRCIVNGDGQRLVGVYFNPYQKLSMRLMFNGEMIMYGYAKMTEIVKKDNQISYKITLNGELGKVIQEMKKITFNPSEYTGEDKEKYYIDGSEYVDSYINKELVASCWQSNVCGTEPLLKKSEAGYSIDNIIGFAPNNAFDDDFDYKTVQYEYFKSTNFTTVLENEYKAKGVIYPADDLVGDGLLPRDIGEFRSYLQLPFIFFNKLFQIFKKKAETVTGYDINLKGEWFNDANPYWTKLVMMLKRFDYKNGDSVENIYSNIKNSENKTIIGDWTTGGDYTSVYQRKYWKGNITYEGLPLLVGNVYSVKDYNNVLFKHKWNLSLITYEKTTDAYLKTDNALVFNVILIGSNNVKEVHKVMFCRSNTTVDTSTANQVIYVDENFTPNGKVSSIDLTFDTLFMIDNLNYFGESVFFHTNTYWVNNSYPVGGRSTKVEITLNINSEKTQFFADIFNNFFRTNGRFTLNDLWDNDKNIFDFILNYCKMYRIGIFVDENNKCINFEPFSDYFGRNTIEDWTDKLDLSKDYIISPLTWEDKYILFNYDDNTSKINEKYVKKYSYKFGEKKLVTDYNFNTDTDELFSGIKCPIVATDNSFSWNNLIDGNIRYSFPDEIMVHTKNSDNKYIDNFGTMYFYCGTANFDYNNNKNMRGVGISDDTIYQTGYNTYFYAQALSRVGVYSYQKLDVVLGNDICLFNVPNECYTYENNYAGKVSIYDAIWSKYIKERYNIQNKVITCYLNITPFEFASLEFNAFKKIGNQLYMINKIYDYDISNTSSTKVDLITVQNIEGYK